jgi:hypothetical protein
MDRQMGFSMHIRSNSYSNFIYLSAALSLASVSYAYIRYYPGSWTHITVDIQDKKKEFPNELSKILIKEYVTVTEMIMQGIPGHVPGLWDGDSRII